MSKKRSKSILAPANATILIMVDGLGIPSEPLDSSIYAAHPTLARLFANFAIPLDACLGLPGTPQSATGQTALFTGVNAATVLGEHLSGFPNAQLREIIERDNIFRKLQEQGYDPTFANAYARLTEANLPVAFRSVTTVATLAAFDGVRTRDDLLAGHAVYHDLTREWLRTHGGLPDVPLIDEEQAAGHLVDIARSVDFCLFEYFLTDHAAHRGNRREQDRVLTSLDRFLARLLQTMDRDHDLLLITSDHGNIEDPTQRLHTRNPVPWIAVGRNAERARTGMKSILDVTPKALEMVGGLIS